MKKLMIAAASAAMIGGAYAASSLPEAQVYDVSLTIKTTKAASAKNVTNKTNPIAIKDKDEKRDIIYRAQTSITWKGLIWGCDCESINGVWENATYCDIDHDICTVKGCVLWDTKGKTPVYFGNEIDKDETGFTAAADLTTDETLFDTVAGKGWGWKFLQCINKDGKKLEGAWAISSEGAICEEEDEVGELTGTGTWFCFAGAGFGSANLVTTTEDGTKIVWCESAVSSISGNFAGWMMAPAAVVNFAGGCAFCGGYSYDLCKYAEVWKWCEDFNDVCECTADLSKEDRTAAYGTWTIKYNGSLSKKLTKTTSILNAYNFNSLPKVAEKIAIAEKASNSYLINIREGEAAVAEAKVDLAAAKIDYQDATAALAVKIAAENDAVNRLASAETIQAAYATEQYQVYEVLKAQYEATWRVTYSSVTNSQGQTLGYLEAVSNRVEKRKDLIEARDSESNALVNVGIKEAALIEAEANLKAAEADCAEYCN